MAERGACHAHRAGERDVEHGVPLLVGHLGEFGRAAQPGVVHEHVEMTELVDAARDRALHVVFAT